MDEYIKRKDALVYLPQYPLEYIYCEEQAFMNGFSQMRDYIMACPEADVTEEENILKFYYVRSIDDYWLGRRVDNFYYAEYVPEIRNWVWTHSRYLPWGEHVVEPDTLWKEHTYPSEPEEIPFHEWLNGFIKKYAANVVERKTGKLEPIMQKDGTQIHGFWKCSCCEKLITPTLGFINYSYCPWCGAKMEES